MLLEEIKRQPEPVLREVLHYMKFLSRQREEEAWADVLPSRKVEQEVFRPSMAVNPRHGEIWLVEDGEFLQKLTKGEWKSALSAFWRASHNDMDKSGVMAKLWPLPPRWNEDFGTQD